MGGRDWEYQIFRPTEAKRSVRPHPNRKQLGGVVHACHLSNTGKCKSEGLQSVPAWAK
jgi:hypothetical protein